MEKPPEEHPYFEPIDIDGFSELTKTKVYACDICGAMVGSERRTDHSDWHARIRRGIRAATDTKLFSPEVKQEEAPRPEEGGAEGSSS